MNSLTQKIQKEIPSLMELSEGCVIKYNGMYFVIDNYNNTAHSNGEICLQDALKILKKGEYKVIGHPIQLNHVLKYLLKMCKAKNQNIASLPLDYLYKLELWNLESNLLSEQPKPLLEWLDKIE
jgi:hypothetical protein